MTELLPWHEAPSRELMAVAESGRLAHALLLHGPGGWGKRVFARQFARALLGLPRGDVDAVLPGEERSDADLLSHPDARIVAREPAPTSGRLRTQITVDQIRDLTGFLGRTASSGGRRVVILERAEELNVNAANALLKSLEEPGADTHLLVVCDAPSRTLATIRSRCQLRSLPPGQPAEARAWLASRLPGDADADALLGLACGAPLLALEHLRDGAATLAATVEAFLEDGDPRDLVDPPGRQDPDEARARAGNVLVFLYRAIARRISAGRGGPATLADQRALERILAARRMLASTANPNVTLLLEDLLLPLGRARRSAPPG